MKGPKTLALVVSGFVVLATGFAFADQLTAQNISVSEEETTTSTQATTTTVTTAPDADHNTDTTEHTRSTVGCPDGFTGNHGQFVSSVAKSDADHDKVVEAAKSDCGKPEHEAGDDHEADDAAEHDAGDDHGDDHGPSANSGSSSHSGSDDGGSHDHGHSGHGGDD